MNLFDLTVAVHSAFFFHCIVVCCELRDGVNK